MTKHSTTVAQPTRTERDLARVIGRRCHGRTAVVGPEFAALERRLSKARVREAVAEIVWVGSVDSLGTQAGDGFDCIVIAGVLEYRPRQDAVVTLERAFELLADGGRLIVCVPNGDHAGSPDRVERFSRATFKRLLKKIDQPKEFADQPFAWLLMALHRNPALDRPIADRCRAIAGLCRGRVMELGCGPGHLSAEIAARGHDVCAIDMNGPKIDKARRRHPGVAFHQADILEWPPGETFDTVVLAEVLEHVPADVGARMLEQAWTLVAPGGRLVVSVPNEDCVRHPNHVREFAAGDLAEMLQAFGAPRVHTEQPLKWLLASVDRNPERRQETPS